MGWNRLPAFWLNTFFRKNVTTRPQRRPVNVFLLFIVIVFSIGIRLWLAPMRGHVFDITQFKVWTLAADMYGLQTIYSASSANYPPLALIPFGIVGIIYRNISPNFDLAANTLTVLIKIPAIATDLITSVSIYVIVKRRFGKGPARVCAAVHALNPAIWYTSAWWGQIESYFALPMLLAVTAMEEKRPNIAWAWYAVGLLFKPQASVIAPVLLVATWLLGKWRALITGAAAACGVVFVTLLPWTLAGQLDEMFRNVAASIGNKLFLTMNAHNLWYLVSGGRGSFAFRENNPLLDTQLLLGPLTGWHVGLVLIGVWTLFVCYSLYKGGLDKRGGLYLASAAMVVGFFMLPAESHERYIYPVFLLLAPLLPEVKHVRRLYGAFSLTFMINMLWVDSAFPLPGFSENLSWGLPVSTINFLAIIFLAVFLFRVRRNGQPDTKSN